MAVFGEDTEIKRQFEYLVVAGNTYKRKYMAHYKNVTIKLESRVVKVPGNRAGIR